MLIVANTVSPSHVQAIKNLPCKVCDATGYLRRMATELGLDYTLEGKLHQAMLDSGLASHLKITFARNSQADVVIGLTLQEALVLKAEIPESVILYPALPIPNFDGICFSDVTDMILKITALLL